MRSARRLVCLYLLPVALAGGCASFWDEVTSRDFSVGKVFATTLLAQAVKQGELSLDDPVAKYVTELQRGGDIRRITLGQLASHTSGLPDVPGQYEH